MWSITPGSIGEFIETSPVNFSFSYVPGVEDALPPDVLPPTVTSYLLLLKSDGLNPEWFSINSTGVNLVSLNLNGCFEGKIVIETKDYKDQPVFFSNFDDLELEKENIKDITGMTYAFSTGIIKLDFQVKACLSNGLSVTGDYSLNVTFAYSKAAESLKRYVTFFTKKKL